MEVDEQGVLAALIHTTSLLRALATGLLPETCVWYTERFGNNEIPFDDWVNQYRIEQDENAASVNRSILSKLASDGLGKPDEQKEGYEGSAEVVQDKRSETLENSPVPSTPALFATEGCVGTEGPALPTSQVARMAKLCALATQSTQTQLPSHAQVEERSPARTPPQSTYSHCGRRLFKKAVIDPEAIEDSHDDNDYTNGDDEESNDNEKASANIDNEEELQSGRRMTKGKASCTSPVKDAKDCLDTLMAKQDEEIEAIAREYGKPVELCYKYVDGGDSCSTHAVTYWNIWQQWYSIHVPVSEWTGVVRKELDTFLHGKLPNEDFNSPEAREEALEEQINWYWEHHNALIGDMIAKGRGSMIATKILRPIVQMPIMRWDTIWVVMPGILMPSPASSWGPRHWRSLAQLVERQVESELAELYQHCVSTTKEPRDHHRAILPRILAYDLNCIFDKGDVTKLNFANFVASTWKHQVRVKNWPVGVPFFQVGVKTKKGFVIGVAALNRYKASDLNKICGPHMEQIQQAVDGKEVNDNLQYFEVEWWTDEERACLRLQWSTIPVVSDTENKTIVSVAHSESYCMVHGDAAHLERALIRVNRD
ncbi:hypothetical protein BDP27DRAFT_1532386 [Rhodocollybia butyracea]|uniref:Uncharacterized protein n=1 Tax=Rhodocollybia butyracea TaxID=206335 RepID=A0A9P5PL54_9AGAR|nr:hypothetical protein BDP27DRAFT_1532386 [Rhodocollybia butyracea]